MPASSTSSSFSWALYIGAAFSLCLVLASPLSALSNISRSGEATRIAQGVASVIDGLKPGMIASLRYDSLGSDTSVHLEGNTVTVLYGNESWSQNVAWQLSGIILTPGKVYTVQLQGGIVEVSASGGG